jgi:hypothetical protein
MGQAMTIYQKFSDIRKSEVPPCTPAKVAQPAQVELLNCNRPDPQNLPAETCATFATCARSQLETEFFAARRSTDQKDWQRGVQRLDIDRPLEGVPLGRWQTFVTDAARFLVGPFAEQASALGWTALDLFGCDDSRPLSRLDLAGLIWLLNGKRLVALTAETAVIQTGTGTRHTYRRPRHPSRVLAWELG